MKDTLAPDDFYTPRWVTGALRTARESVSRFDGIPNCADGDCKGCHHCYLEYVKQLREREVKGGEGDG